MYAQLAVVVWAVFGVKLMNYAVWALKEVVRAVRLHTTLPGPPQALLMGNVWQVIAKPVHLQVEEWARQYGAVFRIRFLHRTIVVVSDPEIVSAALRSGPTYLPKYHPSYEIFESINRARAPSILTAHDNGTYWRAVRKAAAQAFTTANLKLIFPQVVTLSQALVGHLIQASCEPRSNSSNGDSLSANGGGPCAVDVDGAAQRLTVDVIGKLAFGRDFGACGMAPNEQLRIVSGLLQGLQMQLNPLNRLLPWRKDARYFQEWRDKFDALVTQMVQDAQQHPPPAHTIMARLLSMTDPDTGRPLSRAQLCAEAATMLVGGFETTAHSIAWTLFLLATHPEAEAAVVGELRQHGLCATPDKPTPRPVEWSDLGQLKQLDAAMNEALRLFPAASGGTARCVTSRGLQVGKLYIPPGSMIWFPTWAIHRDPAVWGPDAAEFKPSRWLTQLKAAAGPASSSAAAHDPDGVRESGTGGKGMTSGVFPAAGPPQNGGGGQEQPHGDFFELGAQECGTGAAGARARGSYMPFSHGPRDCVGQSLAVMEMRVALATLLGHASFSLAPEMGGFQGVAAAARQHITLKPMVPGAEGLPARMGLLMHVSPRVASACF